MDRAPDSTHPDFWNTRYAVGKTPWDFGGVPAALSSFLKRSPGAGTVLIPGCGSGYEIRAFQQAGHEVTAIDFSLEAVKRAKDVLGLLSARVIPGDFFRHDFGGTKFDLIYERTFLCSLPPECRRDYERRMAGLLARGGRLVGIFLYGEEKEPPPYPMTDATAKKLFSKNFRLERTEEVDDSLEIFRGMEKWQEWGRK
jgi:SAM-dependent methyltransferase